MRSCCGGGLPGGLGAAVGLLVSRLLLTLIRLKHCAVAIAGLELLLERLLELLSPLRVSFWPVDTPARRLDSRHAAADASATLRRASDALLRRASAARRRASLKRPSFDLSPAAADDDALDADDALNVLLSSDEVLLLLLLRLPSLPLLPPSLLREHVALHVSWHCDKTLALSHLPLRCFFWQNQPSLASVHGAGLAVAVAWTVASSSATHQRTVGAERGQRCMFQSRFSAEKTKLSTNLTCR